MPADRGRPNTEANIEQLGIGICNCYLLRGRRTVLVDAGASGRHRDLARGLDRLGIPPDAIDLVVVTHGHADHIGAAHAIKEITGAPFAIHASEAGWLASGRPPLPPGITAWGRVMSWLARWLWAPYLHIPPVQADVALGDDPVSLRDEYGIPGEIVHTPGHSPGSVSILLDSGEAFVGDMATSSRWLRRTPGLHIFGADQDLMWAGWERFLDAGVSRVFPAHGEPFAADVMREALQRQKEKR